VNKKQHFSDQEIDDLLSKVDIPLDRDKDLIWADQFESIVKDNSPSPSKEPSVFRLYSQYGMVASFSVLLVATFYLVSQNTISEEAGLVETLDVSEQDLLADQTMIESLFVEDNDFDDWFEEQYVLSSVN
jgi:hypothetical protein